MSKVGWLVASTEAWGTLKCERLIMLFISEDRPPSKTIKKLMHPDVIKRINDKNWMRMLKVISRHQHEKKEKNIYWALYSCELNIFLALYK